MTALVNDKSSQKPKWYSHLARKSSISTLPSLPSKLSGRGSLSSYSSSTGSEISIASNRSNQKVSSNVTDVVIPIPDQNKSNQRRKSSTSTKSSKRRTNGSTYSVNYPVSIGNQMPNLPNNMLKTLSPVPFNVIPIVSPSGIITPLPILTSFPPPTVPSTKKILSTPRFDPPKWPHARIELKVLENERFLKEVESDKPRYDIVKRLPQLNIIFKVCQGLLRDTLLEIANSKKRFAEDLRAQLQRPVLDGSRRLPQSRAEADLLNRSLMTLNATLRKFDAELNLELENLNKKLALQKAIENIENSNRATVSRMAENYKDIFEGLNEGKEIEIEMKIPIDMEEENGLVTDTEEHGFAYEEEEY